MKNKPLSLVAGLALLGCATAWSQSVPALINFQGQLLDGGGSPLPNGDYVVEVRLFAVESGGAAIWGPQIFNGQSGPGLSGKVPAVQGYFNLILGPQDTGGRELGPIFAANGSLFIELKIGGGSPIAPRQQMLAAPYALQALNASNATKLGGFDWTSLFAGGNPQTGNMGVGVAPSTLKLDVNGRMRVRQGTDPSAGIWFNQNGVGDRGFVGMLDNDLVGFYTPNSGWAFTLDGSSGISSALALNVGGNLRLGSAIMYTTTFFGEEYLWVNGVSDTYFFSDVWATAFHTTSDERLKENVETLVDPLETVQAIRGVSFNFKENPAHQGLDPHQRRIGVLAQDVQKVLPEAVNAGPDGFLSVDYNALIPVLLQAVKEQQRQIDGLQDELNALKAGQP